MTTTSSGRLGLLVWLGCLCCCSAFFSEVSFADVPDNITCDAALPIALNTTVTGDNTNAPEESSDGNYPYYGLWYSFTVPESSYYRFSGAFASQQYSLVGRLTEACGDFVESGYNFAVFLEPGRQYTLKVGSGSSSSPTLGGFTFKIGIIPPPANDRCADAQPYALEDGILEINTEGSYWDGSCAVCGATWDVWFSFTPETTAMYRISSDGYYGYYGDNLFLSLYNGCVGDAIEEKCFTPPEGSFDCGGYLTTQIERTLEAGQTYYIALAGPPDSQYECEFSIETVPDGDDCSQATPFSIPGSIPGSTFNAQPQYSYCAQDPMRTDIWYAVTPETTGVYGFTLQIDESSYYYYNDFDMALYTDCQRGAGVSNTYFYDYEGMHPVLTAPLEAGETYLLEIGDDIDEFVLNAVLMDRNSLAPENDDCSTAAEIQLGAPISGSTAFANDSLGFEYFCHSDVWYSFTPPETRPYCLSVTPAGENDAFVGLYGACGGKPLAYGVNTVCYPLEAGTAYYIAVGGAATESNENIALDFQLAIAYASSEQTHFSGGMGVEHNPFLIGNRDDLLELSRNQNLYLNASFLMIADIDMTGVEDFTPIGFVQDPYALNTFTGSFEGANHEIAHLSVSSATGSVGIFGVAENARISGIRLRDCAIEYTGDSVGVNSYAGGIAGEIFNSKITDCNVAGSVASTSDTAGGIVGNIVPCDPAYSFFSAIQQCQSAASVYGLHTAGGIVGNFSYLSSYNPYSEYFSRIDRCSVTGPVLSKEIAGGIIGIAGQLNIVNSSFTGLVQGGEFVGGIAGNTYEASIVNCIVAGRVATSTMNFFARSGAIIGRSYYCCYYNDPPSYGNFWSQELTRQTASGIYDTLPSSPVSTAELLVPTVFNRYSWEFQTPVWRMTEGVTIPRLAGVHPGLEETCTLEVNILGTGGVTGANPGFNEYWYGQPAILDIAPESLPFFSHWVAGDGLAGDGDSEPHLAFIMEGNRSLTAVFNAEESHPVASLEDLEKIGTAPEWPLDWNYHLTADIDAAGSRNMNDGAGFAPIGSYDHPFTGTFEGNGHVVENLFINRPNEGYVGLFACIAAAATLYNLGVTGHIYGGQMTGGIAGASLGTIANCHALCAVTGMEYTGEIAGLSGGTMDECWSGGTVRSAFLAGGLGGALFENGQNSFSAAWITTDTRGYSVESFAGGALGATMVFDTYGYYSYLTARLHSIFSTGLLSGYEYQSLFGSSGYYLDSLTGDSTLPLYNLSTTGPASVYYPNFGRTTAQLTDPATFAGWDFDTPVWTMSAGYTYPHLARTGPQDPQQLTLAVTEGGAVRVLAFDNGDYTPATAPYRFEPGTPLRLEAVPEEGYIFQGWAGLPVLTGHNESFLQFTLLYDATIAATFVPVATPTPYASIAEGILTGADAKEGQGNALLWGVLSPDVTGVRINGAALALNSILCAETIYSTYTNTHISGMRKWTWLSGPLDYGPNTFTLEADAETPSGTVTATAERTVTVADPIPPVLTLLGSAEMTVECGDAFDDPGAAAEDNVDGDISASVTSESALDTALPGAYTVTYSVADAFGNLAVPVSRAVTVSDTTPPVLTLEGAAEVTLACTAPYVEPGAAAADVCDGDLSAEVIIGGDTPNSAVPGVYSVTYNVNDAEGNAAGEITRAVLVTNDVPPTLELDGAAEIALECKEAFVEPGYAAHDGCLRDLTDAVTVSGALDSAVPGEYVLFYEVVDNYGHSSQAQRTVRIHDTLPPTLSLLGPPEMTLVMGTPFLEPGFAATDACDGDLGDRVSIAGIEALPGAPEGDYTLTYSVADPSGNTAQPVTRMVHVTSIESVKDTLTDHFEDVDANDDNTLDFTEAETYLPGLDTGTFNSFDTNNDSRIEFTELVPVEEGEGEEETPGGCGCFDCEKSFPMLYGDWFMMLLGIGTVVILSRRN